MPDALDPAVVYVDARIVDRHVVRNVRQLIDAAS